MNIPEFPHHSPCRLSRCMCSPDSYCTSSWLAVASLCSLPAMWNWCCMELH